MSELRELLEQERRRHAMPSSFGDLERRRDRKRRNRRVASAVVAFVIASVGVGGALYAVRRTGTVRPAVTPTTPSPVPSTAPSPSVEPTSSPSPSPTPPPVGTAAATAPAGPVAFVDAQHGWIVDDAGRIEATSDGGRTWKVQASAAPTVQAVDMITAQRGWAISDHGVLSTADGGRDWTVVSDRSLSTIQFLDSNEGWGVATDGGRLLHSTDGGASWSDAGPAGTFSSVCFGDAAGGWATELANGRVTLLVTRDGGDTWDGGPIAGSENVGFDARVRCGQDGAWVLATGDSGAGHTAWAVFRTVHGGSKTTPALQDAFTHPLGTGVPTSSQPIPADLVAIDQNDALVVDWCPPCGGDQAYASAERTDDGGGSWTVATLIDANHPAQPLGASFVDPQNGWVLLHDMPANEVFVLRTSDGGQTWQRP